MGILGSGASSRMENQQGQLA